MDYNCHNLVALTKGIINHVSPWDWHFVTAARRLLHKSQTEQGKYNCKGAFICKKERIKNNKPEGSEVHKCAMLDLYLTEWEVVQRELQQWLSVDTNTTAKTRKSDFQWQDLLHQYIWWYTPHLQDYCRIRRSWWRQSIKLSSVFLSLEIHKKVQNSFRYYALNRKAHPSQHYCVSAVRVHVYFSGSSTACTSVRNSLHLARNNFCYLSVTFPSRVILQEDAMPTAWVDVDESICQLLYLNRNISWYVRSCNLLRNTVLIRLGLEATEICKYKLSTEYLQKLSCCYHTYYMHEARGWRSQLPHEGSF